MPLPHSYLKPNMPQYIMLPETQIPSFLKYEYDHHHSIPPFTMPIIILLFPMVFIIPFQIINKCLHLKNHLKIIPKLFQLFFQKFENFLLFFQVD